MNDVFLADTYAIIEIINGNKNYKKFENCRLLTTKFNLVELYYSLLQDFGNVLASQYLLMYSRLMISITYNSIRYGMAFKLKHKKEKLSYVDCIGYAVARENGIRFLTGDEKFRTKENVEFVK